MHTNSFIISRTTFAIIFSLTYSFFAQAGSFKSTFNTSTYSGTNARLAFDFIGGDGNIHNSVIVSNFFTDGSLGSPTNMGDVTGILPATSTLQSTSFFNEILQPIALGNAIGFDLNISEFIDAGATLPDALSVFLLDGNNQPLFNTTDPTGANALFVVNIDGSTPGGLNVYTATPDTSSPMVWSVSTIPEPSVLQLSVAGLIGFGVSRFRKRYHD